MGIEKRITKLSLLILDSESEWYGVLFCWKLILNKFLGIFSWKQKDLRRMLTKTLRSHTFPAWRLYRFHFREVLLQQNLRVGDQTLVRGNVRFPSIEEPDHCIRFNRAAYWKGRHITCTQLGFIGLLFPWKYLWITCRLEWWWGNSWKEADMRHPIREEFSFLMRWERGYGCRCADSTGREPPWKLAPHKSN